MTAILQLEWFLNNPEVGWLGVFLYLFWEIRGPKGKLREITDSIRSITIVVRALARANDDVNTDEVDQFLVDDNGNEPGDFLDHDHDEHHTPQKEKQQE